ncbi:unnamed protein product, partial [Laminaria digitata]
WSSRKRLQVGDAKTTLGLSLGLCCPSSFLYRCSCRHRRPPLTLVFFSFFSALSCALDFNFLSSLSCFDYITYAPGIYFVEGHCSVPWYLVRTYDNGIYSAYFSVVECFSDLYLFFCVVV